MNFRKNLAVWVIIAVLVFTLFNMFQGASNRSPHQQLAFSDFVAEVNNGTVRNVTIQGKKISGHFEDGRAFRTYAPNDPTLISRLGEKGVHITAVPLEDEVPSLFGILISWFPMLLLIGIWIFFMRQMQSGGGKAMGFGKSRARLLTEKSGRITFEDEDITGLAPDRIVARGIIQVPEGREIFATLSVRDNLQLGAYLRSDKAGVADDLERVLDYFPPLQGRLGQRAGTLSGGEQQMLAIGRALMSRPKLLMMDEPSLGLSPVLVDSLFEIIARVQQTGVPILLVEQNASVALAVSDFGYILENGEMILNGESKVLQNNEAVKEAYLGL